MERTKTGDPSEQDEAISELAERAQKSNDKYDWNEFAMALFEARRFDQAISILDSLIQAFPNEDVIRLNLATAYSQVSQVGLCRLHLKYLAEHGGTEEIRKTGREQLEGYEQFIGFTEADTELRKLQIAALREATSADGCSNEDFLRLAKLLRRTAELDPDGDWMQQSRAGAPRSKSRSSGSGSLLEGLAVAAVENPPADSQKSVELAIAGAVILGSLVAWLQTSIEIKVNRKGGKLDFSFNIKKDATQGKTLHDIAKTVAGLIPLRKYPQDAGPSSIAKARLVLLVALSRLRARPDMVRIDNTTIQLETADDSVGITLVVTLARRPILPNDSG